MEETATYLFNGLQVIATVSIPIVVLILNRIFKLLDRQNKWMQRISDNDIRQDGQLVSLGKASDSLINDLKETNMQVYNNKDDILKIKAASG